MQRQRFYFSSFLWPLLFVAVLFAVGLVAFPKAVLADGSFIDQGRVASTLSPARKRNPTPTPTRKKAHCRVFYRVQQGDTVLDVARKCRISAWRIRSLNRLKSNRLKPGQVLRLRPAPIKPRRKITPQPPVQLRRPSLPTPQYGKRR